MDPEQVTWSQEKWQHLNAQLVGFWAQDEWNLAQCPLEEKATHSYKLRFNGLSSSLATELKYACWQKLQRGEWAAKSSRSLGWRIDHIVDWLNLHAHEVTSLLDRSVQQWIISLRSYLLENSLLYHNPQRRLNAQQQPYEWLRDDPHISLFRQMYVVLQTSYDDRPEYDKDIWDIRRLGVPVRPSSSQYKLNFSSLTPLWLKQAAKQYFRYRLSVFSVANCCVRLCSLRSFSVFLSQSHPALHASDIDRSLILGYVSYLSSSSLSEDTRCHYLVYLRQFFELCAREKWADFPEKPLIYREDIPRRGQFQPRFIPQEVLEQLHQHLETLPLALVRMVLIIQDCGMRISELCTLSLDCLLQDTSGDWFLRYYQAKMKKEHCIPISHELAAVIQQQQQAQRERWGDQVKMLFLNARGRIIKQEYFVDALNNLAYEKSIRDATGALWRFQSHQFRHTVGTKMINSGVPLYIVQRYLGHESPEMTCRYAAIHDQTMKEEYAKFRGKVVDVTGKVVEQDSVVDTKDLQWVKKNILAQALPNGKCALPVIAGNCPHANACLTCVHFRTDASFLPQHKIQLQETHHLIQVARQNGWRRQVEMNETVAANLEQIIGTLESNYET